MSDIREDKNTLNGMFQELSNVIVPSLPAEWIKIVAGYFIETESKVSHFQLFVLNENDDDYLDLVKESWESDKYDNAIVDAEDVCKKIHEICCKVGDDWSMMTFVVECDGAYNVDYSYEPIKSYDARYLLDWQSSYLA
ncbi:hypothetical protein C823_001729 [Eubacterium plexicaudatum ASF492]|uniref:DUF600 family protein n=1 Tax=Eubacterium plexicaudatum ASF492 TaxID=1235802 RepID=N2BJL7_9FIRM|nr:hypothetical protein C823_001729 [Eubacterium plexicaudatum ASF492]